MSNNNLQQARIYAAKIERDMAAHCFDPDYGFADHVTDADKQIYQAEHITYAEEIEQGLHDNNFTIWQRMNYYLTGECVPLLPKD